VDGLSNAWLASRALLAGRHLTRLLGIMKKLFLITGISIALIVGLSTIVIITANRKVAKRYSYSEDIIYKENANKIDALVDIVDGGVGSNGDPLESGRLIKDLKPRYKESDFIALSKNSNPNARMVALCCLNFDRNEEYIYGFSTDSGVVRYRSGCTINRVMPIGDVVRKYWFYDERPSWLRMLWKRITS
jgi:hypothetical protein